MSVWMGTFGVLLACGFMIVAALSVPVPAPEVRAVSEADEVAAPLPADLIEAAHTEDLGSFLAIRRWGAPESEVQEAVVLHGPTATESRPINPVLLEMHYVGLIAVQDQRVVLLDLPETGIVRYAPGDTLPDGRVLVSVTDDSLTLKAEGLPAEELMLFPEILTEPPAASSSFRRDRERRREGGRMPPRSR